MVSSPWSRSAARTCASIKRYRGMRAKLAAPTWSAKVETDKVDAFALEAIALPVQRNVHSKLVEHDRGQQSGADIAARSGMERRRRLSDCLTVPAQVNFSRTVSTTLNRRGASFVSFAARVRQFAFRASRADCSAKIIACASARSEGSDSDANVMRRQNHIRP